MIVAGPELVKVGIGTSMLKELGARMLVVAAPLDTIVVDTAAMVPEVGIATVLPPEIDKLLPMIVKVGIAFRV